MTEVDLLIIGGGLVGASLACALEGKNLRIGVVEAGKLSEHEVSAALDARSIALSYGSYRIFDRMGLWSQLQPHATPIQQIHVSDRGHFGITRFVARDEGVPALGYVIEVQYLNAILHTALARQSPLALFSPAKVQALQEEAGFWQVTLRTPEGEKIIRARLIAAIDGSHSTVRALRKIPSSVDDYGQSAILTNVQLNRDHHGVAYERFTENGPLALLPLGDQRCALVWTVRHQQLEGIMQLNDEDFLRRLQGDFGYRLGRFIGVGQRHSYPLQQVCAKMQTQPGLVLLGNAAHTLHPVAGQGFNLGLRDAAVLAELLHQYRVSDPRLLTAYTKRRESDQKKTIKLTDSLVQLFSNSFTPLVLLRNAGLLSLDALPLFKHYLARHAMGLG